MKLVGAIVATSLLLMVGCATEPEPELGSHVYHSEVSDDGTTKEVVAFVPAGSSLVVDHSDPDDGAGMAVVNALTDGGAFELVANDEQNTCTSVSAGEVDQTASCPFASAGDQVVAELIAHDDLLVTLKIVFKGIGTTP